MMTNTKWLRRALLGGVALSVMATGAQADELTDLKSQLEALQSRVNQLEQEPKTPALPEGTSFLTMSRGMSEMPNYGTRAVKDDYPSERGFTIAVTPTADLPAPVAEVVVYGYVKGDVILDFDVDTGPTFFVPGLLSAEEDNTHVQLHAFQSRFGIDSRVDTAIGQIRTKIEGDFYGSSFGAPGFIGGFRLRHAYGEWDMTPNWTLLVGQTWRTAVLLPIGVSTIDFSGSAGAWGFPRAPQVRLTYHAGPISWAVAAERPSLTSDAEWPNFSAYVTYDIPGGHNLIATASVADETGGDFDLGWVVLGGANINLADIATFTVGGLYGEGEHCTYLNQVGSFCGTTFSADSHGGNFVNDFFSDKGWGVVAGLSFNINETTSVNVQYGISRLENNFNTRVADHADVQTIHGNIMWQPVQQMRLGWEVMWGRYDFDDGPDFVGSTNEDAIRTQFGAWFFF